VAVRLGDIFPLLPARWSGVGGKISIEVSISINYVRTMSAHQNLRVNCGNID
jgi:hypothetical protein